MRHLSVSSLALLPLALLMTGCGMGVQAIDQNVPMAGVTGNLMGGATPITNAKLKLYAIGTGGYGTTGTLLSSTNSDSNGNFVFPNFTCPQANTPVYILSIGGNTGGGVNPDAVLGVNLGTCSSTSSITALTINEVTTAAMAYTMAYYFNDVFSNTGVVKTTGFSAGDDFFGGPSTTGSGGVVNYSKGLTLATTYTAPSLVNIAYGGANPGNGGITIESQKINTIADILATCVESTGETSTTETKSACGKLFNDTKNGLSSRPIDTLQAAVEIALHPAANVAPLYKLIPTSPAYGNYLTSTPNDFSLGIEYPAYTAAGLAVPTGTVTTLDIDGNGNVWVPSNATGKVGAVYFTPYGGSYYGPYNGTSMVNPTQVAVSNDNVAWFNDSGSSIVSGYSTTTPNAPTSFSMTGSTSTAVSVLYDNSVVFGLLSGGTASLASINQARSSYTPITSPSSTVGSLQISSLAGDAQGGVAIAAIPLTGKPDVSGYYYSPSSGTGYAAGINTAMSTGNDANGKTGISGQTIATGNDFLIVKGADGTGTEAGLCIFSGQTCYQLSALLNQRPIGLVEDGQGALWYTSVIGAQIIQTPITTTGNSGGQVYLNSNSTVPAGNNFTHGSTAGNTMIAPAGIGVDFGGNVWVSNAGCTTTGCTPTGLVISEVVGIAGPTITPVSANFVNAATDATTGTEPQY